MKLHLVLLSAFAGLAAAAVAGNSQGQQFSHLSPSPLTQAIPSLKSLAARKDLKGYRVFYLRIPQSIGGLTVLNSADYAVDTVK
ncbi:hypothetical protein BDV40DRAFT_296827 [Aspergillus tamarii]|uniref:Uncharacterized protein n=1 Tax=Aspergillus tamarii TaxID=41984 RepID=A0A5N6V4V3_ASPTM|nr:hypothetical protein BDV40DRAFT_296827 [Aspergillus tamarii]